MRKVLLKILSFEVDHKAGKTHVVYHHWDGKYFCLECALDKKNITLDGVSWDSPDQIKKKILNIKYGDPI